MQQTKFLMCCLCVSSSPEPAESEPPASLQASTDSSPLPPDTSEERQIVTLVVEEEEEEDQRHKQSTVTLMEEEEDEKREEEEQTRRDADRNHWDGQTYCPFSSFSSLSLSCVATLPELLHRWCSARLARERLRSVKRRQLGSQTQPDVEALAAPSAGTPQQSPVAAPTPVKDPTLPLTEATTEADVPAAALIDAAVSPESHATAHPDARDATPELNLLLEPSRTVSLPPHSFSDIHSSPPELAPPIKVAALDAGPTPTLQVVTIPETQHASSPTPSLTINTPQQQAAGTEATMVLPHTTEQPVQALPTASRPDDLIPPPTELPPPLPASATDTQTDSVVSGLDGREPQAAQLPQANGEQADAAPAEPQRVEEAAAVAEEDLLSTAGNGNMQRTATDFYAELQNGGDYVSGTMNGNGLLMNSGAVHGSSQKESVFMRLNNRIKALEMNMSLSSRYLEELSQRYSHKMQLQNNY